MARTRSRTVPGFLGYMTEGSLTINDTPWPQLEERCTDEELTPGLDHTFNLSRDEWEIAPVHGLSRSLSTTRNYFQYANPCKGAVSATPVATLPAVRSTGTIATECLSRTNPSRAHVSVPNFVYELKDLPGMLHDIGRLKQNFRKAIMQKQPEKLVANQYLAQVMGWSPLISDIAKMLDFQSRVDKRVKELHRLYQKGGMRRSYKNKSDSARAETVIRNLTITSHGSASIRGYATCVTTRRSWSSVRWIPTAIPKDLSNDRLARQARDLVFGLNAQPKYLWDALPWSWLVDWFGNVGEFVNTHSAVVPATSSKVCVMHTTIRERTVIRTTPESENIPSGGYARFTETSKQRFLGTPTLSATLPFLSGRQTSILGALAVQRLKR